MNLETLKISDQLNINPTNLKNVVIDYYKEMKDSLTSNVTLSDSKYTTAINNEDILRSLLDISAISMNSWMNKYQPIRIIALLLPTQVAFYIEDQLNKQKDERSGYDSPEVPKKNCELIHDKNATRTALSRPVFLQGIYM